MFMKTALIAMAVLVAGLIEQTRASPLADGRLEACLKVVDSKIDYLKVPEELKKLAEDLRALNPNLKHLSLIRLVDEDSVITDAVEKGVVREDRVGPLMEQCNGYVGSLVSAMSGTECGEELLAKSEPGYGGIMEGHAKLEELLGYAKVCTATLQTFVFTKRYPGGLA